MAVFETLGQAGTAIAERISAGLKPATPDIVVGAPLSEDAVSEALRLTLLWITPQPTHRNDPWRENAQGQRVPPPVTLTGFYLLTAYGASGDGASALAVNLLGDAIAVIATDPVIDISAEAGQALPEGRMSVILTPMAPDVMEKVFSPLQTRHRPWALFEVGPIQLQRRNAILDGAHVVRPGGVNLVGPGVATRPAIRGASPLQTRPGGRIRLDVTDAGGVEALRIGQARLPVVDPPGAQEVAPPDALGRIFVTVPEGLEGDAEIGLLGASTASARVRVRIEPEGPSIDAPETLLAPGSDLSLTGAGLADVTEVYLWPEPPTTGEIRSLEPEASAESLLLRAADLGGLAEGVWRVAARVGGRRFTPYVRLEVTR